MINSLFLNRNATTAGWCFATLSVILSLLYILYILSDYSQNFVHPHRFDNHLEMLLNHGDFKAREILNIFKEFAPGEYRPRFLTYALILLDLRFRIFIYSISGALPPTFSLCWIFYLFVGPWLVYQIININTNSKLCAVCTTALYISSVGFLSSLSMYFTPGKPLSNIVFLIIIYLFTKIKNKYSLFTEASFSLKAGIFLTLCTGLFLDEMPLFGFIIPLILFPELLIKKDSLIASSNQLIQLSLPFFIFLFLTLFVVPLITQRYFQYQFDYLGSLFAQGGAAAGAKSLVEGPYGKFGISNFFMNASTLFGISLVPWQIAPYLKDASAGGVISGQSNGLIKYFIFIAFIFTFFWIFKFKQFVKPAPVQLKRLFILALLFIIFISALSGRHVPYITSYYYACAWSAIFCLIFGLLLFYLLENNYLSKLSVGFITLLFVVIQINNFSPINNSYISIHNQGMVGFSYKEKFPLNKDPTTLNELRVIYDAWANQGLDDYLASHTVSAGSIFLIKELQWIRR